MNKTPSISSTQKKSHFSRALFAWLMLLPGIILVLIFTYYPALRGVVMAFQSYTMWNIFDIKFIGFDNFKYLFNDWEFMTTLPNTLKWIFVSLFFQFTLGFVLALFLKSKFRGRGLYQGAIFFPWAISGFLIGLIFKWLLNGAYGPINAILINLGLVNPADPIGFLSDINYAMWSAIATNVWYGIAFFAIMIQAALQGVPVELYEAAEVDGASIPYKFFKITVPCIKSVLILTTLLRVIWINNFADLIYSLTGGGPGGSTHIMTSYMLDWIIFGQDYGKASATGLIILALLMGYSIFYMMVTRFEEGGDMQ